MFPKRGHQSHVGRRSSKNRHDREIVIPKKHPKSPWHFMVFNGGYSMVSWMVMKIVYIQWLWNVLISYSLYIVIFHGYYPSKNAAFFPPEIHDVCRRSFRWSPRRMEPLAFRKPRKCHDCGLVEWTTEKTGEMHGISMGFLWDFYRISMGIIRDLYGISMGFNFGNHIWDWISCG